MRVGSRPLFPLAPPGLAPVLQPDEPLPALERELARLGVHCITLVPDTPNTKFVGLVDTGHGYLCIEHTQSWSDVPPSPFNNKRTTKKLLTAAGFKVPVGQSFRVGHIDRALEWFGKSGLKKVVVKPTAMSRGRGVGSNIETAEELEFYLRRLPKMAFLIEEYVEGDDHRLLVVGGRVVACTRRVPAHLIGDGRSTIRALVEAANLRRAENPVAGRFSLELGAVSLRLLSKAGLTPDSIPEDGQVVFLRTTSNVGSGGTHEEVSDKVHPCYIDLAERIAAAVARDYAVIGVDILCRDITAPEALPDSRVLEIEKRPGVFGHARPVFGDGPPRNARRRIAENILRRYGITPVFRRRCALIHGETLDGYADWLRAEAGRVCLVGHVRQIDETTVECDLSGGLAILDALIARAAAPEGKARIHRIACFPDRPADPAIIPVVPQ